MYHLILLASVIASPILNAIGPDTELRTRLARIVRQRRREILTQRAAVRHRLKIRAIKRREAASLLDSLPKPELVRNDSTHEVRFPDGSRLRLELAITREQREAGWSHPAAIAA